MLARLILLVSDHYIARLFVICFASLLNLTISLSLALRSLRALSALCVALPVREMGHVVALAFDSHIRLVIFSTFLIELFEYTIGTEGSFILLLLELLSLPLKVGPGELRRN